MSALPVEVQFARLNACIFSQKILARDYGSVLDETGKATGCVEATIEEG
jgi:hypothetical protein